MPEASSRTVFSRDVDAAEDFLRLLEQIAAGFGQPDLARGALQELDAEAVLQFEDDAADGWLGHCQAFGGAVEVEFLGHGDEGREVLQVVAHIDTIFISMVSKMIISQPAIRLSTS